MHPAAGSNLPPSTAFAAGDADDARSAGYFSANDQIPFQSAPDGFAWLGTERD
jgi:hypothetical protein